MTLAEHISQNIFAPRLESKRILVVFDEHERFSDICTSLESERCKVIFTDKRPISSRQDAMTRWAEMAKDTTYQSQMLIHSKEAAPKDNEERQQHPFASYAVVGSSFPSRAGDDYRQLCYGFLKDRTVEIDQLFDAEAEPGFDLIDNLAGGTHAHPRLQAIFKSADASKIIPNFLVPPPESDIEQTLDASTDWCEELRQLLERTLGIKLNAKSTKAATIRKKLWQYLLFSEFASDLPAQLPAALIDLPRASGPQLFFSNSLCVDLRKHTEKKEAYRDAANEIEQLLNIAEECSSIVDLGKTDTFSFEEKKFLHKACTAIRAKQWDSAREILDTHKTSLWTEEGERKLLWRILELGLESMEHIKRAENHLKHLGHAGKELCEVFDAELVKVDRYYRNLEEATAQTVSGYEEIEDIVLSTRSAYRSYYNLLQTKFYKTVEQEGWPLDGMEGNVNTYNDYVAPALRDGKRVVYFLVDALRLDLAQDLETNVYGHKVERIPACAQLPCVTRFGMASLLPDAANQLSYRQKSDDLVPYHGETEVNTRKARIGIFESQLNDRVTALNLEEFTKNTKTTKNREAFITKTNNTDLLVLTSTELDTLGEGSSTSQLQHIPGIMRELQLALTRCADVGFDLAIIATDHGFIWIEDADSGSLCEKPAGQWKLKKRRCLLGTGDGSTGTKKFGTSAVSIPSEQPSFVVPSALATFERGTGYFHEGLSLQESLVPRLRVTFTKSASAQPSKTTKEIGLHRKKKSANGRIVAINISWPGSPDMFAEDYEFKLVATQQRNEVGQPTSNEKVDSSTGFVRMVQGESIKVSILLNEKTTEGPFQVKAIDPTTEVVLDTIDLNFNPTVF